MWGYSSSHFVTRVTRISVHPHGVIPCNPTYHFWKVFSNFGPMKCTPWWFHTCFSNYSSLIRNMWFSREMIHFDLLHIFFKQIDGVVQLAQCYFPHGSHGSHVSFKVFATSGSDFEALLGWWDSRGWCRGLNTVCLGGWRKVMKFAENQPDVYLMSAVFRGFRCKLEAGSILLCRAVLHWKSLGDSTLLLSQRFDMLKIFPAFTLHLTWIFKTIQTIPHSMPDG